MKDETVFLIACVIALIIGCFTLDRCDTRSDLCKKEVYESCAQHSGSDCAAAARRTCDFNSR